VLYFTRFYAFTREQWALLAIAVCAVIGAELVNTALERACDAVTLEPNPLIKAAKDIAAGAVLAAAIGAAAIGVVLFGRLDILWFILLFICGNPFVLTLFILTIVVSVLFIVLGPAMLAKKKNQGQ